MLGADRCLLNTTLSMATLNVVSHVSPEGAARRLLFCLDPPDLPQRRVCHEADIGAKFLSSAFLMPVEEPIGSTARISSIRRILTRDVHLRIKLDRSRQA